MILSILIKNRDFLTTELWKKKEEMKLLKELIEEQARYDLLTDIAAGVLVMLIGFFVVNILVDKYKKKDDYF